MKIQYEIHKLTEDEVGERELEGWDGPWPTLAEARACYLENYAPDVPAGSVDFYIVKITTTRMKRPKRKAKR